MPPPMPNPAKRMTANPARPVARYRPGKPIAEEESSDEDEESEEEQQQPPPPQRKPPATRPRPPTTQPARQEESDEDDEEGFVTEEEDDDNAAPTKQVQPPPKGTAPSTRQAPIRPESTRERSTEDEESEEEESSEDEEEEETSSEEEQPRRKFQRPTFIKKSDRKPSTQVSDARPEASATPDPEVDVQTRRLAQAELLIKDKLERDALARAQGKKAWDDDDEVLPESMVDDTDGLDPAAEYAAWKLRELKRLKRDREALIAREKELEEIERRRNLTAEEREKEDQAYLERQKQEREEGRSEATFLARYHHKGAFFQGDETAELLKRRDIMGARFEDQVTDKSTLPEYMRLRDMTKLGKKGRTRYTDLKGEDTGRFGDEVKRWKGSGGAGPRPGSGAFDTRGLDERFLPDDDRGGGRNGPTGANASAVAPRRDDRERNRYGHRDTDSHRDSYRSRDSGRDQRDDRDWNRDRRKRSYSWSRSGSRSRSRSPRRRKREHSYERDSRDREPYSHRRDNRAKV
ncbi:putative microfibrillar-associated protein [Fonsecaea pedrosoi]|nr:putative microfibrillar-associated protein [Fonsecaea pedrosoi]